MKAYLCKKANAHIRYHEFTGEDIPILFIHGLGCTSSFDYPQVASMNCLRPHRSLMIDLLGSGYSDKPDDFDYTIASHVDYLLDFITHMNLQSFFLYGHSMGGSIAIEAVKKKLTPEQEQLVRQYYYRGISYYTNNNFKKAITEWRKVLAIDPGNVKAKNNIRKTLVFLGR